MKMASGLALVLTLAASGAMAAPAPVQQAAGEAVFGKYCAQCHDHPDGRIPPRDALKAMSPQRILRTLDFGLMMSIAYPIKREDRMAVANFLGGGADESAIPKSAYCGAEHPILPGPAQSVWNGWSADAGNNRYQSAENAGLYAEQVGKLVLKWAFGFPGDVTTFGAPTVLNGTLFTGSAGGGVYAIDAKTGCLHWVFQADGPVRSAPLAVIDGGTTSLVFGDQNGEVYALDAHTGKQRWKKRVDDHEATRLTASPAIYNGVVFIPAASWEETRSVDVNYPCCTFRGSITALSVKDGAQVWKSFMVDPPKRTGQTKIGTPTFGPSGAGVWSTPTVDEKRGMLYITTGDNYSFPDNNLSDAFVALDLKTGKVAWSTQTFPKDVYNSSCGQKTENCPEGNGPDYDFGASPMLVHGIGGRDVLVAGQKSGVVFGVDPDNKGKMLWQQRVGKGGTNGGVEWGTASDGRYVYAATSDLRQLVGDTHKVAPVGDANLDPNAGGGVTAMSVIDGEKVWTVPGIPCMPVRPGCSPAQPGAVTAIQGAVFSGSMDGHIRAYSTTDGKVIWDFDTEKEFKSVNGVKTKGGALNGAGPVIAGGMVFVNSGYPRQGGTPGNALLAFGPP
jgi:polyvinyl alcohol dehydrogenase (cytochrome)